MCIATVPKSERVIKALDPLSGTTQQFINTDMDIDDIKILDNTVFTVDKHKLVGWDLKAGGMVMHVNHGAWGVAGSGTVGILMHLTLSHDSSQIAFTRGIEVLLYDIRTQGVLKSIKVKWPTDIWFTPDGCQLWYVECGGGCTKLDMADLGSANVPSWKLDE